MGRDRKRQKRSKKKLVEAKSNPKEWGETNEEKRGKRNQGETGRDCERQNSIKRNWGEAKSKQKDWGETNEEKSAA